MCQNTLPADMYFGRKKLSYAHSQTVKKNPLDESQQIMLLINQETSRSIYYTCRAKERVI